MKKQIVFIVLVISLAAETVFAHCDWINGPVVADARAALTKGDVTLVLRWVPSASEPEIRRAFERTLAARASGDKARDVADQWFFETVVRVHRASEGEPFTGLEGTEYTPNFAVQLGDNAINRNSIESMESTLTGAIRSELHRRFAAAIEARKHANESIDAGRRYVHAYTEFIHYLDNLHRSALTSE